MGSSLYGEILQLLHSRIEETVYRSLTASLAARSEQLQRELQLARSVVARNAELAALLDALIEYVNLRRRAVELAAKLARTARGAGLAPLLAALSSRETRCFELVARFARAYAEGSQGPARIA